MKEISLYVHIPFCESKCAYCAFTSFCATDEVRENYVKDLCEEIKRRKTKNPVKTIYIGGGTPSVLTEKQISQIVNTIYENYDIYDNAEFTIEVNPNSLTAEKLACYKSLRINRLSVGVQSLNNKSLKKIGRLHDKKMALEKIKLARKTFDNVSADLIVGLENESGKDLCGYARELLALGVKHISCYLLEIYENTKIYQMIKQKKYTPLDDDKTIDAFEKLSNYLVDAGMERYEISNFAFEGYESKHNLNYWSRGDYLGFGLSACSFENGKRTQNALKFDDYGQGIVEVENLSEKEEIEEIIMLGLRCKLGVDLKTLKKMGYNIEDNQSFKDYLKQGVLKQDGDKIFLNPCFYHISNGIIANLLP